MSLGSFGSVASKLPRPPSGGAMAQGDLMQDARDQLIPSPEGTPGISSQLYLTGANYSINLLINGDVESWTGGASAAPDAWTLAGAGASVARNTTSGQVRRTIASVNVSAAINTATTLSQTLTLSATVNPQLRGREVTLSAQVLASVAGRVTLRIDDGITTLDSLAHSGNGSFEELFVTKTIDSAATQIQVLLVISSGAVMTATMDAAILCEGRTVVGFSANPNELFLLPRLINTTGPTTITNQATVTDMTNTSIANIYLNGKQSVLFLFMGEIKSDTVGGTAELTMQRNSSAIGNVRNIAFPAANSYIPLALTYLDRQPSAGAYTYNLGWRGTNPSIVDIQNYRLQILVFPDV